MSTRAAWRYSSFRWAESPAAAPTRHSASADAAKRLLAHELRAIVVGGIAVDGVDVIDAALLRRVFDHERRSLHAKVGGAAGRRRAAPGEVRLRKVRADLGHARLRERVVHETGPFAHDVEQHGLL